MMKKKKTTTRTSRTTRKKRSRKVSHRTEPSTTGKAARPVKGKKRRGAYRQETDHDQRVVRRKGNYGRGYDDDLHPTVPLDLARAGSVSDLVALYGDTAFSARQLSLAAEILQTMTQDEECFVVLTVSGAMTVAKMGLVICDMIENGMVDAIVSTGALMAHGFVEASGRVHFKHDPSMNDRDLFERGYNRVYDTLELEQNLDEVEEIIHAVVDEHASVDVWSSAELHRVLGQHLSKSKGRGILKSAYQHDVPVYVPAFSDSELGLDFAIQSRRRTQKGQPPLRFDPFLDLEDYTRRVDDQNRLGIFTIGGGVPRNWAQQVGPYLDILQKRLGLGQGLARFRYGVRICPEPVHWGGLSGCTYSEGVSWGKFLPPAEGGRFAEVYAEATIAWPLVVKAVLERLSASSGSRPSARR